MRYDVHLRDQERGSNSLFFVAQKGYFVTSAGHRGSKSIYHEGMPVCGAGDQLSAGRCTQLTPFSSAVRLPAVLQLEILKAEQGGYSIEMQVRGWCSESDQCVI